MTFRAPLYIYLDIMWKFILYVDSLSFLCIAESGCTVMRSTVGFLQYFLLIVVPTSSAVTTVNTICSTHTCICGKLTVLYREMRHVTSLGRFTLDDFLWDEFQRE